MPSLKEFARRSGMPRARRWSEVYTAVREDHALAQEARVARDAAGESNAPGLQVEWRAVSRNAPSLDMPRSVPWVHGLIRDARGPSARLELAPKRRDGDRYPVHLILAAPDQQAAEAMSWDDAVELEIDGHSVRVVKSMGPVDGWADPVPGTSGLWALVAELDADHPLVVHAAEAAAGPQTRADQAVRDFDAAAREWGDRNFPHPDWMNVVRKVHYEQWTGRDGYWPGDPLPDVVRVCELARDRLRGA